MSRRCALLMIALTFVSLLVGCATPTATPTAAPAPTTVPATAVPATAAPAAVPPTAVPPTKAPTTAPTTAPTVAPTTAATAAPTIAIPEGDLILATTSSTRDAGLLPVILPDFEAKYKVKVGVVAVGSGQALKLGQDGNVSVLLVHDRPNEDVFMTAGHGSRREDVMYNDFVIVGPKKDAAGIKGMTVAADAMAKIAAAKATFISRGDNSGTHSKEKALWKTANITPEGTWYVSAGQTMGAVLTMALEQQAYTLSDRATYLARKLEGYDMEVLVEGDKTLYNPYGVIAVNPNKGPQIKADLANKFIDWIISVETQEMIGKYGVDKFNAPLFYPDSTLWRAAHPK